MSLATTLTTIAGLLPTIANLFETGSVGSKADQAAVLKEASELLIAVAKLLEPGTPHPAERTPEDLEAMEISSRLKKLRDHTKFAGEEPVDDVTPGRV